MCFGVLEERRTRRKVKALPSTPAIFLSGWICCRLGSDQIVEGLKMLLFLIIFFFVCHVFENADAEFTTRPVNN